TPVEILRATTARPWAVFGRSARPPRRSGRPSRLMAALASACTCAVSGCGAGDPQERVGVSDEALFGGAAVSRCQWTNVVAVNEACSGVLLHPDLVVYAAHCGTSFDRVWSSSQEMAVRDCQTLPNAALGGTDLAYCRLATSFSAELIAPASGC